MFGAVVGVAVGGVEVAVGVLELLHAAVRPRPTSRTGKTSHRNLLRIEIRAFKSLPYPSSRDPHPASRRHGGPRPACKRDDEALPPSCVALVNALAPPR